MHGGVMHYIDSSSRYFLTFYFYGSVYFNSLNNKDWLARDMAIDPAFDITVHTAEEDEDTVDVNQLYNTFQKKMLQNQIVGNRKADGKANQRDLMD